ncbi:unnamed protein product [Closterium sp. Yama58-4]|nr:unnamed protein product [Closterium sp. Yama58-4]
MIHLMKFDMGGAAAVLGAAKAIAAIQPQGVQVNNTDAEGRLTLADALLYAQQQGVEKIVDVATLTGACIIALGNDIAGLFTPSDELSAELEASSRACGDKVWRMPMEEAYWEGMRSKHADMLNTSGREGGSITAALFLKQFVAEGLPWAHVDIGRCGVRRRAAALALVPACSTTGSPPTPR